jgi:hypothetical protein
MPRKVKRAEAMPVVLVHRLKTYALAASAAGVGLLALAKSADAEIVYTPANTMFDQGTLPIDLLGDGNVEFTLIDTATRIGTGSQFRSSRILGVSGSTGASVVVQGKFAGALESRQVIGSSRRFKNVNSNRVRMADIGDYACGSSCSGKFGTGPWQNAQDLFLGLKFQISGETHYGWARLTTKSSPDKVVLEVRLSGYAYETVAGQSLKAGQRTGSDDASLPEAGTVGALAGGAVR